MPDYARGKIYKIIDNTNENIYIGSTCEPTLARRLAKHVGNYKDFMKGGKSRYMTSYKIIENRDYDIILVENFPCETKDQLLSRERYWTNKNPCINKIKEQGIIKKIGKLEYHKQYNKKYYEENIEDFNEKGKLYRQVHKQKIKKYKTQPFQCDCGSTIQLDNKSAHLKTRKHLHWIEENENN